MCSLDITISRHHLPLLMSHAALHLARHRVDPHIKQRGLAGGPRLVAFTSDQSHYSYEKAAALIGLGTDNMVAVATDEQGQMLPSALEAAVAAARAEGKVCFAVPRVRLASPPAAAAACC